MRAGRGPRRGGWVLGHSGRRVYLLEPRPDDYCIDDVARGLAVEPRFAGQTREPYSVAQHACFVAEIVEAEKPDVAAVVLLTALFHDATEAFLGDLVRPLKYALPKYRAIEARMWSAMCARFGLIERVPGVVNGAHERALATERRDLFPSSERRFRVTGRPMTERVSAWPWREAERRFLDAYERLFARAGGARLEVSRRIAGVA